MRAIHRSMARSRTVQLADPRADAARPATWSVIAIAAGGLGLLLMLALARTLPDEPAEQHEVRPLLADEAETAVHAATAPETSAPTEPRPEPVASLGAVPPPEAKPVAPAFEPSEPAAPGSALPSEPASAPSEPARPEPAAADPAPPAPTPLDAPVFEPGIVAYLRCDGLERKKARYPCPRDRPFEERVWRELARLTECSDLGRGSGELRLDLQNAQVKELAFRSSTDAPGIDATTASRCVGPELASARTSLRTPDAVVSFRFALK